MAIGDFRWSSRDGLLFGGENLLAEEISTSEGYAERKDGDVRGRRNGHCGRYKESQESINKKTGADWRACGAIPSPGRVSEKNGGDKSRESGQDSKVRGTFPRNISCKLFEWSDKGK